MSLSPLLVAAIALLLDSAIFVVAVAVAAAAVVVAVVVAAVVVAVVVAAVFVMAITAISFHCAVATAAVFKMIRKVTICFTVSPFFLVMRQNKTSFPQ